MTVDDAYILDSNVFIEAARRYYAFDIAPSFWNSLIRFSKDDKIKSIDKVMAELAKGNDDLSNWADTKFRDAFISTDDEQIIDSYRNIIEWVQMHSQFSDEAKANFAGGADGWLIAVAIERKFVVVTQETIAPDAKRKIPIPNVCNAFDIEYIDTFSMLRKLGVKFN